MKLLLLTKEYPPHIYGGAGVHVDYISRELARRMQVEVRCFGDQDATGANLRILGFEPGSNGYGCPAHLRPVFSAAQRCLAFNSRGIDADIVHCHTWHTHLAGVLAKLNYGVPLVITVHSLEPLRPWKRQQLERGYDYSRWIEKVALEMADAVIAVSRQTKEEILGHFEVREDRVHVIYNGIDPVEFRPAESRAALPRFGIDAEKPYLLFVGRITRQKGVAHLARAIRYMAPGFQVVLCAGAPDTPKIGAEVKELMTEASAKRGGVIWIEEILDKKSLIELYSHAAVFCCPSIYEPFGLINLEAMACETPVVASAIGGISEVVVDRETGFLVPLEQTNEPPYDPLNPEQFARDLAERINLLMTDPDLRRRLGVAGRRRAVDLFSWTAVADRTLNLYEHLLSK